MDGYAESNLTTRGSIMGVRIILVHRASAWLHAKYPSAALGLGL
jgi:hypothetical protein